MEVQAFSTNFRQSTSKRIQIIVIYVKPHIQTNRLISFCHRKRVCNSQAAMILILLYSLVLVVQAGVGCDMGMFGERCDQNCSSSCATYPGKNVRKCQKDTGICAVGCIPGWYGEYCNRTCSGNCRDKICNQQDGLCTLGCAGKYIGDFCNKEIIPDNQCPPGQFGDICGRICPPQCAVGCGQAVSICERDTGKCHGGCRPGWHGDHCNLTNVDFCKDYISKLDHTSDQGNRDQVSVLNKEETSTTFVILTTVSIIANVFLVVIVLLMFLERRKAWYLQNLCRNQDHSENPAPDKEKKILLNGFNNGVKKVTEEDRLDIDA